MTTLSVVIGAVGNVELTRRCVESVRALSALAPEIVLVDNGSTAEESDELARLGAQVLLHYPTMIGYPAAMNAGVRAASGEYVCLLNNDVEIVQPGWDARLVSVLQVVADAQIAAPTTNFACHPQMVRPEPETPIADETTELILVSDLPFVCAMMRRAVYVELGGLDEGFGMGNFEDTDLCWRVRQAGGLVVIDPAVWVRHVGHATFDRLEFGKILAANHERFAEKWQLAGWAAAPPDVSWETSMTHDAR